ncbi:MAG: cytochrome c biogenesis protein CcsA [Trueperaceae bacterium]|nr:cytochrome c biogenesis protein CcsA [Trueperaceae bacterium]
MAKLSVETKRPPWLTIFGLACLVLLGVGIFLSLVTSPPDINQGDLIRVMYAHVSVVWVGFIAVIMTAIFGMMYLWRSKATDDIWAVASAEMALIYFALAIIGGMTYSKPTLGVFWDWDAKLTLTALEFALLVGYFIVRGLLDDPKQRARISAVVSIIVLASLPFNWMAAKWFRTLHPSKSFDMTSSGVSDTMAPIFRNILLFNVFVAALIFVYFLLERVRLGRLEVKADSLEENLKPRSEVVHV